MIDVHNFCAAFLDLGTAGKVSRLGATLTPATHRTENGARNGKLLAAGDKLMNASALSCRDYAQGFKASMD